MNTAEAKKVLETALLCAHEPLTINEMRKLFADDGSHGVGADTIKEMLLELRTDWADKGIEVVGLSTGWRFQSRPEMKVYLERLNPEKPPKYTRATLETLAIIAYRQPVTRGDIEEIRGVTVNAQTIKLLEDRNWIEAIGHRDVPGRPALFATTKQFLDDLGLSSLEQLPPLQQVGKGDGSGSLDLRALEQELNAQAGAAVVETVDGETPAEVAVSGEPVADVAINDDNAAQEVEIAGEDAGEQVTEREAGQEIEQVSAPIGGQMTEHEPETVRVESEAKVLATTESEDSVVENVESAVSEAPQHGHTPEEQAGLQHHESNNESESR